MQEWGWDWCVGSEATMHNDAEILMLGVTPTHRKQGLKPPWLLLPPELQVSNERFSSQVISEFWDKRDFLETKHIFIGMLC